MPDLLEGWRGLAAQEALIPALRACLLLFGLLAAGFWLKRRPVSALLVLALGGLIGLGYWLGQIVTPFGSGTDALLIGQWAQAGVNALAEPGNGGYVRGTPSETSLVANLASVGIPLKVVFATPQIAAFFCLVLLALGPLLLIRNRTSAAFAGALALGGGLWPGLAPYGGVLQRPAVFLGASAVTLMGVWLARGRRVRQRVRRRRFEMTLGLIGLAVLGQAWSGGGEPGLIPALSLAFASIILATWSRPVLRCHFAGSPSSARAAEAAVLLCAFGGSGLYWWNPPKTLPAFIEAREGGTTLQKPLDWIKDNVPPASVVLASPAYSAPIATLAGRRVLFPPPGDGRAVPEPFRRARLYESSRKGEPIARLAEAFSVTHLFLGPGEATASAPASEGPVGEPRLRMILVYQDAKDFRIFRLATK